MIFEAAAHAVPAWCWVGGAVLGVLCVVLAPWVRASTRLVVAFAALIALVVLVPDLKAWMLGSWSSLVANAVAEWWRPPW